MPRYKKAKLTCSRCAGTFKSLDAWLAHFEFDMCQPRAKKEKP